VGVSLVAPTPSLHESWARAMTSLHPEGRHVHGSGLWMLPEDEQWDLTPAGCSRLVTALLAAASDSVPSVDAERHVPCHFLWITTPEDGVVGFLALRTRLNAWLLEHAGHIGYSVAPPYRRRGHAGAALALAVRRSGELGLDRVLVTCDEDNVGSARTIEGAGGELEDVRSGKRRYWIATS
jgi:predicted acetyltransferase